MDRGVDIIFDDALTDQNGIFKVVTIPRHEGAEHILTQGKFSIFSGWPIGYGFTCFDFLPLLNQSFLIDTSSSVGTHELTKSGDIHSIGWVVLKLLLTFW